ncbi:Hypothetical predicted protein, partial [Pelobates cultripes]
KVLFQTRCSQSVWKFPTACDVMFPFMCVSLKVTNPGEHAVVRSNKLLEFPFLIGPIFSQCRPLSAASLWEWK